MAAENEAVAGLLGQQEDQNGGDGYPHRTAPTPGLGPNAWALRVARDLPVNALTVG
jgi:hypothetical protein